MQAVLEAWLAAGMSASAGQPRLIAPSVEPAELRSAEEGVLWEVCGLSVATPQERRALRSTGVDFTVVPRLRVVADAPGGSEGGATCGTERPEWQRMSAPISDETTGAGVTVYVLDSGIGLDELFGGRLGTPYCAIPTGCDAMGGHGTKVAAAIAAGCSTVMPGLAPEANLVDVQVLDGRKGSRDALVLGLAWVVADLERAKRGGVVNLSLSLKDGNREISYSTREKCGNASELSCEAKLVQRLLSNDAIVVASAGNTGLDERIAAPACLPGVWAVPGYDQRYFFDPTNRATENFRDLSATPASAVCTMDPEDAARATSDFGGGSASSALAAAAVARLVEAENHDIAKARDRLRRAIRYAPNCRDQCASAPGQDVAACCCPDACDEAAPYGILDLSVP